MADVLARLALEIGANTRDFNKKMSGMQKKVGNFSKFAKTAGLAIGGLFAVGKLKDFAAESVRLADAQIRAETLVSQAIKSTGGSAGFTSEQLFKMAEELQNITTFGDQDILQKVTGQLLTFTNIANDQFERTQKVALDLSTVLGTDMQSSAIQLGKALNDPIANLSALSRSGIQFSTEQKDVIKNLAETNRLAEAQTIILEELERQYGGQAEAIAEKGLGPVKQLQNAWGDLREELGNAFLPIIAKVAKSITAILPAVMEGFGKTKIFFVDTINYFIDLYNESLLFRGAINFIKVSFENTWSFVKLFFENLKNGFSTAGELMRAVFTLQFEEIPNILKNGFTEVVSNYKDGATDIANNYKEAWNNTFTPKAKIELIALKEEETEAVITSFQQVGTQAGKAFQTGFKEGKQIQKLEGKKTGIPEAGELGSPEGLGDKMKNIIDTTDSAKKGADKLGSSFVSAFNDASAGAQSFGQTVKQIATNNIKALIAEGIAGAVKGALEFLPFPANIIAAGVAGAGAAALFSKIIPSFDTGINFVPKDMLALVHRGEKITPAFQNTGGDSGVITSFKVTDEEILFLVESGKRKRGNID